ncbi:MAG: DUF1311 domain-containing protein [Alphaproteobacteria bacterium]|nr:DUF1311 domain-containing protein [Alphaproteobacteria bacterium]MBV9371515.1 DUF1311 domain-containing protein [Alphaproteobacteria bacterium]MBV9902743.1 DUF1311 domain-containing protein [Alphaproteobacteria bacterium]
MIGAFFWLAAAAAGAGAGGTSADLAAAEAQLAALRAGLPAAIDAQDKVMERNAEDLALWKRRADDLVGLWLRYRDARCDPALLSYERGGDSTACRLRITRNILGDLQWRYGDPEGAGALPRASADASGAPPRPGRGADEEGPCAAPPPAECDYCGMNRCWERRLEADEARLNAAWRAALAKIAARPGVDAAARTDWTERLRRVQRLWLRWREDACTLDGWETPNPYAHSLYALVTGPCLDAETEARTAALRRAYALR